MYLGDYLPKYTDIEPSLRNKAGCSVRMIMSVISIPDTGSIFYADIFLSRLML